MQTSVDWLIRVDDLENARQRAFDDWMTACVIARVACKLHWAVSDAATLAEAKRLVLAELEALNADELALRQMYQQAVEASRRAQGERP